MKQYGCYCCFYEFDEDEIEDHVDNGKTPLCPNCMSDLVTEEVDRLDELHKSYFGGE